MGFITISIITKPKAKLCNLSILLTLSNWSHPLKQGDHLWNDCIEILRNWRFFEEEKMTKICRSKKSKCRSLILILSLQRSNFCCSPSQRKTLTFKIWNLNHSETFFVNRSQSCEKNTSKKLSYSTILNCNLFCLDIVKRCYISQNNLA